MDEQRQKEAHRMIVEALELNLVAMQAAWIEWRHGKGAEDAMEWIENTLDGPGLIPDEDAPYGKEPQAWFDSHQPNPNPVCACGRPSNIVWMGKGFCSDAHYVEARAKYDAQQQTDAAAALPLKVRFFWIGEESEVFVAESWEQILADDGKSGTGIDKVVDGVPFDDFGDPIEWGELPGDQKVRFNVADDDERPTGELFEGTLVEMHDRWPSKAFPEMLMTGYN